MTLRATQLALFVVKFVSATRAPAPMLTRKVALARGRERIHSRGRIEFFNLVRGHQKQIAKNIA